MYKNKAELETIKAIALDNGYAEEKIGYILNKIEEANLVILIKEDNMFDIVNNESNKLICENIKIDMIIEIGHDCLRIELENYLRKSNIDMVYATELLNNLNSIFENAQYIIKEENELKYLSIAL